MRLPLLGAALAAVLLAACQPVRHDAPAAVPVAGAAEAAAVPADDNLNAVLWVQRSAEYRAAAAQTYRAAIAQLDAALRQADWDALVPEERANPARGLKPAVILDIDETVLDNSPYQARLVRDGAEFSDPTWDAWVEERRAKALPGMVEFARAADARGITLLYISNRAVHLKDATLDNLRAEGLPVAGDDVFLGLGTVVDGCEQEGSEKDCRRQLAGRQYRVLMQFGDQLGDFVRIDANTPAGRQALLDRYDAWFGQRWWMLPNPTYGSWEPAVFDNDWRQPREARRAAKRDALDVAP
ncbi:5'-nucleotidase, lipoprotein e(P4) family [Pseudoxanthomonas suwonensis]|uniref:Acid phosphatase n=1 Tax=Pseudoxanthomonas suwonensis TaxID=314722 RepID=A0A0E3Z1M6_9GAMM|nr:HAD family acid phosphatase [Pseudoxanthomonas suwonensis]AKC86853.1 acid phosphatase [Pseudoxanthomonas suwonensis]